MGNHLIHTQVIEAEFGNKTAALQGQKTLQEIYYQHLIPVMEEVMDEYDQMGTPIRIEKLDLDLGRIPKNLPVDLIKHRLRKALEEELRKIYVEQTYFYPNDFKGTTTTNKSGKESLESDWEILIYFLRKGRFPWFASSKIGFSIDEIFQRILDQNPNRLKTWLGKNPITWIVAKRISNLCKGHNQKQIFGLFLKEAISENDFKILYKIVSKIGESKGISTPTAIQNSNAILIYSSFGKSSEFKGHLNKILQVISENSSKDIQKNAEFLIQLLWITFHSTFGSASNYEAFYKEFVQIIKSPKTFSKENLSTFWKELIHFVKINKFKKSDLSTFEKLYANQLEREKAHLKTQNLQDEEKVVIHNAGLVLTAAFLPRFFDNIGLVNNGKFVSEKVKSQAVILLQSMMPEQLEWEEPDLLLNKLMCGMEPAETVEFSGDLDPKLIQETALLLESMAIQWTALKSKSGKMVSEGFFTREGVLKKAQRGYHLQIQRLAFDILLDRLPWSIGIIKLPWMEEIISVEW
ncbi:hypothetical protein FHS59_001950 [Algoriphagus iocasae]|uniref:Uncharacterized protein n=1 Tax=Algoriphagus iocasae TaxID=1836499 RepID=A0A841ME20_9BACT|nr:contractile injection system tape measure protein [Algoriphagus iocasae]MBB6326322.1 hypothetical protein [Algoriphagus iocasae]